MGKKPNYPTEILVGLQNKWWRLNNLYRITDKQAKTIRFVPNPAQSQILQSNESYNATLKARQLGITTCEVIDGLDDCLWKENWITTILSHKRESIEKIFQIARFAYDQLPEGIKPELDRGGGSKHEMYFPSLNSRINVSMEVRSGRVNRLHVSEFGLMESDQRYKASISAVPNDGRISIESTPMGLNHFHELWNDPNSPFKKHFFPWYFHYENELPVYPNEDMTPNPEEKEFIKKAMRIANVHITPRKLKWRRFKIAQMGIRTFLVEHPEDDQSCFLASGDAVIDQFIIKEMIDRARPKETKDDFDIYCPYDRESTYIIGADTAGGVGGDYYVGTVYRVRDWKQCAKVRGNKWRPKEFAELLNELGKLYRYGNKEYPLLGVERNNHGHAVLSHLEEDFGYPNLFRHTDEKIGWNTTSLTRPILLDVFVEAVESRTAEVNCLDTLKECQTLIRNEKGKIEAAQGKYDDCVIASAIAFQMIQRASVYDVFENIESKLLC